MFDNGKTLSNTYRISSYSCRGNYSFLEVGMRQLFKGGNYYFFTFWKQKLLKQILQIIDGPQFHLKSKPLMFKFVLNTGCPILISFPIIFSFGSADPQDSSRYLCLSAFLTKLFILFEDLPTLD